MRVAGAATPESLSRLIDSSSSREMEMATNLRRRPVGISPVSCGIPFRHKDAQSLVREGRRRPGSGLDLSSPAGPSHRSIDGTFSGTGDRGTGPGLIRRAEMARKRPRANLRVKRRVRQIPESRLSGDRSPFAEGAVRDPCASHARVGASTHERARRGSLPPTPRAGAGGGNPPPARRSPRARRRVRPGRSALDRRPLRARHAA
jgi:hypothetical protein